MKLNNATKRLTEPSTVNMVATLAAASIWSVDAISPAARLAPTMLIGPYRSRGLPVTRLYAV